MIAEMRYPQEENRLLPCLYRIVVCSHCGFAFDDLDCDQNRLDRYYANAGKYEMPISAGAGGESIVDQNRYHDVIAFVEDALHDKEISIADFGCGKGGLLHAFQKRGYQNLKGIELSKGCQDFIHASYSFPVVAKPVAGEKFNLVTSCQIFEHLLNPLQTVHSLLDCVKDEGFFYVDVPDASRYIDFFCAPYYYFDQEHINHFYPDTLSQLVEMGGKDGCSTRFAGSARWLNQLKEHYARIFGCCSENLWGCVPRCHSVIARKCGPMRKNRKKRNVLFKRVWSKSRAMCLCSSGGIGAYALSWLEKHTFDSLRIEGLIDSDKKRSGSIICGKRVMMPEALKQWNQPDCWVLIASVQYGAEIAEQIKAMGFGGHVLKCC